MRRYTLCLWTYNFLTVIPTRLEAHKNYIFVNCLPMTEMSLLVLPQMVKRNKGVIVNMASCLWRGAPLVAGYSSTKAYVTIMSQCMSKTYSKIAPGEFSSAFILLHYSRFTVEWRQFAHGITYLYLHHANESNQMRNSKTKKHNPSKLERFCVRTHKVKSSFGLYVAFFLHIEKHNC